MRLTDHRCQCAGCGKHFNSVSSFDKHWVGEGKDRHCLSADGMLEIGMWVDKQGWWYGSRRRK